MYGYIFEIVLISGLDLLLIYSYQRLGKKLSAKEQQLVAHDLGAASSFISQKRESSR